MHFAFDAVSRLGGGDAVGAILDERKSTYDSCSFVVSELRRASNKGTLRAFRNANRFTTFKILRRPSAL